MSKCIHASFGTERPKDKRPVSYGKYVYRTLWEKANGPLPQGITLHHLCENPWCVNLAHLEPLTDSEHKARHLAERNRQRVRTHCPNGHPYDDKNTQWVNSSRDGRYRKCRECALAAKRRYRVSQKEFKP